VRYWCLRLHFYAFTTTLTVRLQTLISCSPATVLPLLHTHTLEQQRTSISVNIKERLDFSCALFDSNGGLVANAPHLPVHLGAMQEAVKYQVSTATLLLYCYHLYQRLVVVMLILLNCPCWFHTCTATAASIASTVGSTACFTHACVIL
jgi:Hydantoinase B/oxoprolinase